MPLCICKCPVYPSLPMNTTIPGLTDIHQTLAQALAVSRRRPTHHAGTTTGNATANVAGNTGGNPAGNIAVTPLEPMRLPTIV